MGKTWIFDLDGTIVKHNGYKLDGEDSLLDGAREFINQIPSQDRIILLTSRKQEQKDQTEAFLQKNGVRYDEIMYDLPLGERILINDKKPSGLATAIAINTTRNEFMQERFLVDEDL